MEKNTGLSFKEYQQQAKRTCASLGSDKLDLAHMVLGIHSEYNEYVDAKLNEDIVNANEELADMVWYIANYATFRNYNLEDLVDFDLPNRTISYFTSQLQDIVKKFVAYNKEISVLERTYLSYIFTKVIILFRANGNTDDEMSQALQNNIDKLWVRFPDDGFSQEKALNRNLESERKELEK